MNHAPFDRQAIYLCLVGNRFLKIVLTIEKYCIKKEFICNYLDAFNENGKYFFQIFIQTKHRKSSNLSNNV